MYSPILQKKKKKTHTLVLLVTNYIQCSYYSTYYIVIDLQYLGIVRYLTNQFNWIKKRETVTSDYMEAFI